MSGTTDFIIGCEVACSDGVCGDLRRVIVDPVAHAVTHLVVEPRHQRSGGHLVPVDLVTSTAEKIQLGCTQSEFEALEEAEETQFLPGARGEWGYTQAQMLSLPYYGLGVGGNPLRVGGMNVAAGPRSVTFDRVPEGDVEVRRGEPVHATDGDIGRVKGLVIDPDGHRVTHVLLDEGHLWGEKTVAIPISAVTGASDGVRLQLNKDEVRDLPPVDIDGLD